MPHPLSLPSPNRSLARSLPPLPPLQAPPLRQFTDFPKFVDQVSTIALRAPYAMTGTDIAYGARRAARQ
eukprot:668790-Rhodomonas_salina.1